jgi:FtsZ-interacting cell division protein ZipA
MKLNKTLLIIIQLTLFVFIITNTNREKQSFLERRLTIGNASLKEGDDDSTENPSSQDDTTTTTKNSSEESDSTDPSSQRDNSTEESDSTGPSSQIDNPTLKEDDSIDLYQEYWSTLNYLSQANYIDVKHPTESDSVEIKDKFCVSNKFIRAFELFISKE